MKSPFAACDASLCTEEREMTFRKEKYKYLASFYRCDETGIAFTTTEQDTANLEQVYGQYRAKYGIPAPETIRQTRLKYGLSAFKMSRVLGLGVNQYRLYENGEMPSLSIGKLHRLVEDETIFAKLVSPSTPD